MSVMEILLSSSFLIILLILLFIRGLVVRSGGILDEEEMGKNKHNKGNNNQQNNNKGKEKTIDSSLCPHVKKSFDFNRVKQSQQDQCDVCVKQKKQSQPSKLWICLKCGGKSCTRDHAMLHFKTPRSDNHSVFIDCSNITIWCLACNEFQIDIDSYKNLKSSISDLERMIKELSLKKLDVKNNERKPQNNTSSCYLKSDRDKQVSSFHAIGLINEGNTCYANSVFQCLTRTPKLEEAIIKDFDNTVTLTMDNGKQVEFCILRSDDERSEKGSFNLVEEYLKLHGTLTNKSNNNVKITSGIHILKSLNRKYQQFKWDQQHDAHEFLRMLLDTLRSDIHKLFQSLILKEKNLLKTSLQKNVSPELKAEIKEIDRKLCKDISFGPEKIFGGELVSELRCKQCNTFSKSIEEHFMDLSLPVVTIESEASLSKSTVFGGKYNKHYRRRGKTSESAFNKNKTYMKAQGIRENYESKKCDVINSDESKDDVIDDDVKDLVKDESNELKQKLNDVHEVSEDDKNSNVNGFNDSGINDSDQEVPQSGSGSQASEGVPVQHYQPSEKPWDFIKEDYSDKEKEVAKADSADSALHEMSLFSEVNFDKNDPKPSDDFIINDDDKIDILDENSYRNEEIDDFKEWNNRDSSIPEKFDSSEEEKDRSSNHSWMNWSPEKHRVVSDWLNDSTRFVDGPEPTFNVSPPIYCNDKRCPSSKHEETVFENDGKPLLSSMVYGGGPDMSIIVLHCSDLKDDCSFIKQKVDDYFEPLPDGSAAGSKKISEALNYLENDEKRYSQNSCRKIYPPHRVPISNESSEDYPNCMDKKEENKDCLDIVGEKTTFGETLENGDSDEGLCISSLFDNDVFPEEEMKIYKVKNDTSSSLECCLQEFIREEILTGSNKVGCEECTKRANGEKTVYTTFSKQLLIKKLPDVIIFHLKRFQVQMSSVCKVNSFVSFPVILNMAPYCVQKKKEDLFHLYGVVKHSGGIHSGHYEAYYAHFKNGEEVEWFHANDRTVTKVKENDVLSTQAYLLFYCRLPS